MYTRKFRVDDSGCFERHLTLRYEIERVESKSAPFTKRRMRHPKSLGPLPHTDAGCATRQSDGSSQKPHPSEKEGRGTRPNKIMSANASSTTSSEVSPSHTASLFRISIRVASFR